MKRVNIFSAIATAVVLGFGSYTTTFALFSNSASSTMNTFAAAAVFPSLTPTSEEVNLTPSPTVAKTPTENIISPGDIVINEVFIHNGDNNEWVELFNKTDSPINVSDWAITDNAHADNFPDVPPIPANGYAVIVASGSAVIPSIPGSAIVIELSNDIGNNLSSSSDRLSIAAPNVGIVDSMNYGADTSFFNPSISSPSAGQSMSRNPNGIDTNTAADWIFDSSPTIGGAN